MTQEKTFSWIFLSTALATQTEPADTRGISMIADGINHAVPTEKELQSAFSWLISKGFVTKQGKKYSLTPEGKLEYEFASKETKELFKTWENLENKIKLLI
jgi:hypothetical protein